MGELEFTRRVSIINPPPVMIDTNSLTLFPLSRSYSRHSRICCWTHLGRKRPKANNYLLVSRVFARLASHQTDGG